MMDAVDLLNSDLAELPRTAGGRGSFSAALHSTLDAYVGALSRLDGTDYASETIRDSLGLVTDLAEAVLNVHTHALAGKPTLAREATARAFDLARHAIDNLISVQLDRERLGHLFRLRLAGMGSEIRRPGLFHVPFDLRHLVAPQRYSMLGIPMLYLGSTLFVCWDELGRPAYDEVWVAAVRLREGRTLRVLDFGYRPADMAALLDKTGGGESGKTRYAVAYAQLWPLIAACSFRRRYPGTPFAEEYIVAQQVVAHLAESGTADGIRYFSTKSHTYDQTTLRQNFVFPAKGTAEEGFCPHLVDLLEMTPPMPWSMVEVLGPQLNHGNPMAQGRQGILRAVDGHAVFYPHTGYGRMESHLLEQDFGPVS